MAQDLTDDKSTSGIVLKLPGNKPLPGSILNQFYDTISVASH